MDNSANYTVMTVSVTIQHITNLFASNFNAGFDFANSRLKAIDIVHLVLGAERHFFVQPCLRVTTKSRYIQNHNVDMNEGTFVDNHTQTGTKSVISNFSAYNKMPSADRIWNISNINERTDRGAWAMHIKWFIFATEYKEPIGKPSLWLNSPQNKETARRAQQQLNKRNEHGGFDTRLFLKWKLPASLSILNRFSGFQFRSSNSWDPFTIHENSRHPLRITNEAVTQHLINITVYPLLTYIPWGTSCRPMDMHTIQL